MKLLIWGKDGGMNSSLVDTAKNDPFWKEIYQTGSNEAEDEALPAVDVSIDFTHPTMLGRVLKFSAARRCPLVIGTTGYTDEQVERIREAAAQVPLIYASNTAPGMSVFTALVRQAAQALKDRVDIEILEAHKNRKPDAPSGTALHLVEALEEGLGRKVNKVHGRAGEGLRQKEDVGVHSIRGGGIVSRHEVWFVGSLERITLTHEAIDNSVFASGALEAAKFLPQKEPGLYSMDRLQ